MKFIPWKKIARYSGAITCQSKCRNTISFFTLCTLLVLFGAKAPQNANTLFSSYLAAIGG
jgi:hypothetical protein